MVFGDSAYQTLMLCKVNISLSFLAISSSRFFNQSSDLRLFLCLHQLAVLVTQKSRRSISARNHEPRRGGFCKQILHLAQNYRLNPSLQTIYANHRDYQTVMRSPEPHNAVTIYGQEPKESSICISARSLRIVAQMLDLHRLLMLIAIAKTRLQTISLISFGVKTQCAETFQISSGFTPIDRRYVSSFSFCCRSCSFS